MAGKAKTSNLQKAKGFGELPAFVKIIASLVLGLLASIALLLLLVAMGNGAKLYAPDSVGDLARVAFYLLAYLQFPGTMILVCSTLLYRKNTWIWGESRQST